MKDLLILIAAVLITWAINQIPYMATFPATDNVDAWPVPRLEKVEDEWVEVCPHCGRPYGGE
jgi:hypothetical protein